MKKTEALNKLGGPAVDPVRPGMVSVQLLAANEHTGLGQPGSIVRVAQGTALRMVRLRYASLVSSESAPAPREPVAPAEPAAEDEEVA